MDGEELFSTVRKRPFIPFRIHVSDGSAYDIRHPDAVWMTRRSAYLAMPGDASQIPERALIVSLIHITRLEELAVKPSTGNGPAS
jgi:hypothetical protein